MNAFERRAQRIDRRSFLKYSAVAGAAGAVGVPSIGAARARTGVPGEGFRWSEATIADMQAAMASGEATARQLVRDHLGRIEALDWAGPQVNSIIEVNPDAETIAAALDGERAEGHVRGPLHGIPVVLKDCLATADRMETTAGSLALVGSRYPRDAGVAGFLREAGAIVLGKANMSEWNAYRGWPLHGGWSGRAGMGRNPYALNFSTGDSTSGSAAAVAASFAAGGIGLETYGSIVMPSALCGVVGLKPTLGLTSRSGTIPISFTRDVIGPIGRTVADVAAILSGMVGIDPLDPATAASEGHARRDYTSFLDPDGLRGARIGIWRRKDLWRAPGAEEVVEGLIPTLRELGAVVVDPIDLPEWDVATGAHNTVMAIELRYGIERFLAELSGTSIRTLADIVSFNDAHPDEELRWHNQALLEGAVDDLPLTHPRYARDLRRSRELGRAAFAIPMREHRLDAVFAPTFRRAWLIDLLDGDDQFNGNGAAGPSNAAGYPHLTMPGGFVEELPIGVSFMARAWEEPKLLRYAHALESAIQARRAPRFLPDFGTRDFVER